MRTITLERSWRLSPEPLNGALLIQALALLEERKKKRTRLIARLTTLLARLNVLTPSIVRFLA